jgi:hypothetical protein
MVLTPTSMPTAPSPQTSERSSVLNVTLKYQRPRASCEKEPFVILASSGSVREHQKSI